MAGTSAAGRGWGCVTFDASYKIKDNKYIYFLLKDIIKEVREANVV